MQFSLRKQRTLGVRKSFTLSQGASSALTGDLNLQRAKNFLENSVSSETGTCEGSGLSDLSGCEQPLFLLSETDLHLLQVKKWFPAAFPKPSCVAKTDPSIAQKPLSPGNRLTPHFCPQMPRSCVPLHPPWRGKRTRGCNLNTSSG